MARNAFARPLQKNHENNPTGSATP